MSACRAEFLRLGALGLVLVTSAALADPQASPQVLAPPTPILAPPAAADTAVDPRGVSVERQDLAAPVAEATGVLDPRQGGFPPTLWNGTSGPTVRALLPHLPVAVDSPTLRALARRLLLTAAPPPKGVTEPDKPSLVELRVDRLLALGAVDGAIDLAAAAPVSVRGAGLVQARTEALLMTGRLDGICADPGLATAAGQNPEMAKVQILCQLSAGNTAAGNFGLDLQRDRKPADTVFIAAAEVVGGLPLAKGGLGPLRDPSPVQLAALAAAKLPLPAEAVEGAGPAQLRAIATAAGTPPDQRLAAAERAEAIGVLDTDSLRKLIAAVEFKPDELARADSQAGPRGLALLSRAAEAAADPAIAAALLARALDQSAARGRYATAARLLSPLIAKMPVQPTLQSFAPFAARALLVTGHPDVAASWLDLASKDADGAKAAARLWPLARLWSVADPSPAAAALWRQTVEPRRALVALSALSGLGIHLADADFVALLEVPRAAAGPAPALSQLLDAAVRDNSLGGTVLATLAGFEAGGLDKADPVALARALAALKAVGLEAEARRLAVEILLANGM